MSAEPISRGKQAGFYNGMPGANPYFSRQSITNNQLPVYYSLYAKQSQFAVVLNGCKINYIKGFEKILQCASGENKAKQSQFSNEHLCRSA